MKFVIEIGNTEQKKLIKEELEQLFNAFLNIDSSLLDEVVIPIDFKKKVNELQNTSNYQSERPVGENEIIALAKIINTLDKTVIVLSSALYTEQHDVQTRYFIFIHEISHSVNKRRFPDYLTGDSYSHKQYMYNLYTLFDEYVSDRFAFDLVDNLFLTKSEYWINYINREITYLTSVLIDDANYENLKRAIGLFKQHNDGNQFINEFLPTYDGVALCTAHAFAIYDQYPDLIHWSILEKSKFINKKSLTLIDYMRMKFEHQDFDLSNGYPLIVDFIQNFGLKWEDTPGGGVYYHVLNI